MAIDKKIRFSFKCTGPKSWPSIKTPLQKTTFLDRLKNAWRAFQGKPKTSFSIGVEVKQCSKCDREEIREMEWLDYIGNSKCSACGFSCGDDYYLGAGRFCPECGARSRNPLREGAER